MSEGATFNVRLPSKYAASPGSSPKAERPGTDKPPEPDFLQRKWAVTHSSLKMWRTAKNVAITYKPLAPAKDGRLRLDDLVEYQKRDGGPGGRIRSVAGVDTSSAPSATGSWDWRGRALLKPITSHWEVVGWGEHGSLRWAVTWFARTPFTKEGVDIYFDHEQLQSDMERMPRMRDEIVGALKNLESDEFRAIITELREVPVG